MGFFYIYKRPIKDRQFFFQADNNDVNFTVSNPIIWSPKIEIIKDEKNVIYSWDLGASLYAPIKLEKIGENLESGSYKLIFSLLGYKKEYKFLIDKTGPEIKLYFEDETGKQHDWISTRGDKVLVKYEVYDNTPIELCTLFVNYPGFNGGTSIPVDDVTDKSGGEGSIEVSLPFEGDYTTVFECRDYYGNVGKQSLHGPTKDTREKVQMLKLDVEKSKSAKKLEFNSEGFPLVFKYPSTWKITAMGNRNYTQLGIAEEELRLYTPLLPGRNGGEAYDLSIDTEFNAKIYIEMYAYYEDNPPSEMCHNYTANTDDFYVLNEINGVKIGRSKTNVLLTEVQKPGTLDKNNFLCTNIGTTDISPNHLIDSIDVVSIMKNAISDIISIYYGEKKTQIEIVSFVIFFGGENEYVDTSNPPQGFNDMVSIFDDFVKSIKLNPKWNLPVGYKSYFYYDAEKGPIF